MIQWMLLLQEFDVEIRDKKDAENVVADHLSRLEREAEPIPIRDEFSDEQIMQMTHASQWYVNICKYLVASMYPIGASKAVKEGLESNAKLCNEQVMHKCIPKSEIQSILHFCHSRTEGGLYGSIWVEARATKNNDAKIVVDFVKSNIFYKFGVLKALISIQGSHFCNCAMAILLEKYGVVGQPFVVTNVFPYGGVVEVRNEANNSTFKVNGHQLKPYLEGLNLNSTMGEVEIITLVES
ncbi:hypothetical protein CR513_46145, partial [Mucuna pruriens]